jgi:LacI family transcriptional regulator
VPGRLSVIGYDDSPIALDSIPSLTTVRQPLEEMGSFAANLLLQQISGSHVEASTHLLPGELIVRASTGPAPVE